MQVDKHILTDDNGKAVRMVKSLNSNDGLEPQYLIMHYTAGSSLDSAVNWLTNTQIDDRDRRVSAHIVIGRDGSIVQLVAFDRIAWHAGYSHWEGKRWMNRYSIGIELDNDGRLNQNEDDEYVDLRGKVVKEADRMIAAHWKEHVQDGWLKFPQAQYDAALEVAQALVKEYGLIDVLGHDDIHEGKVDPGPAFPMGDFRQQLYPGRAEPIVENYRSTEAVNLYIDEDGKKPGDLHPLHEVNTLPANMNVDKLRTFGEWAFIRLKKPNVVSNQKLKGWVKAEHVPNSRIVSETAFYKGEKERPPGPQPKQHAGSPLPRNTRLRILERQGDWTLAAVRDPVNGFNYMQGWLKDKFLQPSEAPLEDATDPTSDDANGGIEEGSIIDELREVVSSSQGAFIYITRANARAFRIVGEMGDGSPKMKIGSQGEKLPAGKLLVIGSIFKSGKFRYGEVLAAPAKPSMLATHVRMDKVERT